METFGEKKVMMRKMELLINGASNGCLCQSCENMKQTLSFLQKELIAKNEFIKLLLETQTAILNTTLKPVSLSSSRNYNMKKKIWKIKQLKINIKSTNPSKNKKNNVRR